MIVRSKTERIAVLLGLLVLLGLRPAWADGESDPCLASPACKQLSDEARTLSQAG